MGRLDDLLEHLGELLAAVEDLDDPARRCVFELLDGIDTIHRLALDRLAQRIGPEEVERLRTEDHAVAWLFEAYGIVVDQTAAAEKALATIRPYIHSHRGRAIPPDVSLVVRTHPEFCHDCCTAV